MPGIAEFSEGQGTWGVGLMAGTRYLLWVSGQGGLPGGRDV